jgi:hypothetical protein
MEVACTCESPDKTLRLCAACHRYWMDGRELVSVSRVIEAVYPKKSFDGADPAVIENARERGSRVDAYMSEYLRTGNVTTAEDERPDVRERLDILIGWFDVNIGAVHVDCQQIVTDGNVAGMPDFGFTWNGVRRLIDLKCTSAPEKAWALQLGAYATLAETTEPGYSVGVCEVLHISPKRYKSGVKLIQYDPMIVRRQWRDAVAWYRTMQELG